MFAVHISMVALWAITSAFISSGVFILVSRFPVMYTQSVMAGQGMGKLNEIFSCYSLILILS